MTPWRFSVTDSFTITGRGHAVGGHIEAGTINAGDRFRTTGSPCWRGTVRQVDLLRKAGDPAAVGMLVDVEIPDGATLVQMRTVASPHLTAAGAAWVDGPSVGGWIADRLGPFGPRVDHAVPRGYAAYAVVPVPWDVDPEGAPLRALEALLDVVAPFTGEQPVHSGMWDCWGFWYETGTDPRVNSGVGVSWPLDGPRPTAEERARALAEAREEYARERVEYPADGLLELPARGYYVWTGPLRSAAALAQHPGEPPSLVWPDDRSWFIGAPGWSNEFAIGGAAALIEAVLADPELDAFPVAEDYELDIDD